MATMIVEAPPLASSRSPSLPRDLLDVVVALPDEDSSKALLKKWSPILSCYHVVVISESPQARIDLPDYESHSIADAKQLLGKHLDSRTAALSYGVLVSRRKYVALLDLEACEPIPDADPLEQHLENLSTPSTPYFFNTLYDPFRSGSDFVRGYPFSLRMGVPTAISHGLWTDLSKNPSPPIVDAVLTVPRGALAPLSCVNVAFDRELIGLAMGSVAIVGDLLAGLCAKVICDHLGYGVKTGLPYVTLKKQLNSDQQVDSDEAFEFFSKLKLPHSVASPEECLAEIAKMASKAKLGAHFSSSIEAWVSAWKKTKAGQ